MIIIAFTGGGTGGHIYPGLSILERLRANVDCRIIWLGSTAPLDRSIVEAAGIEFIAIPSGKLRRYFSLRNLWDVFKIAAGFFAARRILRRIRPALVFSKGGFVSVPPCAAAWTLGIPVLTHESDFSPGLATRINLRFARRVLVAYPETVERFAPAVRARATVIGNPVRQAFRNASAERGRAFLGVAADARIALVLGGSLGARQVNELIRDSLDELTRHYMVVHQIGAGGEAAASDNPRYRAFEYIRDELPDVLAASDLVIGRAGAGTVWEAAARGKPMVLIPLGLECSRGDQIENAAWFAGRGAAVSLVGAEANAERLAREVDRIAGDASVRLAMAEASRAVGNLDAAQAATDVIITTLEEH